MPLARAPPRAGAEAARPAGLHGEARPGAPHSPMEEAPGGREGGRCGGRRGPAGGERNGGVGRTPAERRGRGRSAAAAGPSAARGGAGQVGGGRSRAAAPPAEGGTPCPAPCAPQPGPPLGRACPPGAGHLPGGRDPSSLPTTGAFPSSLKSRGCDQRPSLRPSTPSASQPPQKKTPLFLMWSGDIFSISWKVGMKAF